MRARVIRNLSFVLLVGASVFVAGRKAQATITYFCDGFNFDNGEYSSSNALNAACRSYCSLDGMQSSMYHGNMGFPSSGYCQCNSCIF